MKGPGVNDLLLELSELAVLAAFIFSVAGVFGLSIAILRRLISKGMKITKLSRFDFLILFLGVVGILCIGYGVIEPFKLETVHVSLKSKKLEARSKLRLALISDLHCDGVPRVEKKLVEAICEEKPDLILFAGDATNSKKGLPDFRNCMTECSKIAPVYAVDGNHDSRSGVEAAERYEGTGANVLNCSAAVVNIRGNYVWIGGVAIDNERCTNETLRQSPPDSYRIFLYHFPEGIREAAANKVDLFCAGHTHGGQIRMPWYGAIVTMSASGKQFEFGHYKVADTEMYVNRGVGMTGLPVRFLCPPELTIIDVEGEGADKLN